MSDATFRLDDSFIEKYRTIPPPFGFNGVGEFTFKRTYARLLEDGSQEVWWQTIRRVVEGCYRMQERHIKGQDLGWSSSRAQDSAQEMYDRMFWMKFLPPGRGLWAMGSVLTEGPKPIQTSLFNCSFVSTKDLAKDSLKPFCFLMDMSMLGVGVGFDVKGAGKIRIQNPVNGSPSTKLPNNLYPDLKLTEQTVDYQNNPVSLNYGINSAGYTFVIPDTREGWVISVAYILSGFLTGSSLPEMDYSQIRPKGLPIKGFGGLSSGSEPLRHLHGELVRLLSKDIGKPISCENIVDIQNLIGCCVVAGNVRRSAEWVGGDYKDEQYLALKDYRWNSETQQYEGSKRERAAHGWASNNSIYADLGMDYTRCAEQTARNGEPGYEWLENARAYSRMGDPKDWKDKDVIGTNPCFSGDTLIAVADGRGAVAIKDLALTGNDVPVYSVDSEGKVSIKMARNPRVTQVGVPLLRITLDNNTTLDVTPDHSMLLLDGSKIKAKDLTPGLSLPLFAKYVEKVDTKKEKAQDYLRVRLNTLDERKGRLFEHRLIAQFNNPEKWSSLYEQEKKSGWIRGGLVVHHKDYNGLNNTPSNLDIMTYREHASLHAKEHTGSLNPMFGKKQKEATKELIGLKAKERWTNPIFAQNWKAKANTPERKAASAKTMSLTMQEHNKSYWQEQEASTDMTTTWIDDRLYAVKFCPICAKELILEWGKRHGTFCSTSCMNKNEEHIQLRTKGQHIHFNARQQQVLHDQVMVYKDVEERLKRTPLKTEWEAECRLRNVPVRFRTKGTTDNPFALSGYKELQTRSLTYNHRVKSIEVLPEKHTVYNLTVDDNYTVGIITKFDPTTGEANGLFCFQCVEVSLNSFELCNLVETFPTHHDNLDDFKRTLKFAYLYAKTVTLSKTQWRETNRVMLKNRRIGCSLSGIQQFVAKHGIETLRQWCEAGYATLQDYDQIYSDWMCIPRSIKLTSVKPSGSVSLVAGATPGMHWPESLYYIRRICVAKGSALLPPLKAAGYPVEDSVSDPSTAIVSFPVSVGAGIRSLREVSMWEQLSMASLLQRYWSDQQVSSTITFDPDSEGSQIKFALDYFQYQLKGISFLPRLEHGAYAQMPYEEITREEYEALMTTITPVNMQGAAEEVTEPERFCDSDKCLLG